MRGGRETAGSREASTFFKGGRAGHGRRRRPAGLLNRIGLGSSHLVLALSLRPIAEARRVPRDPPSPAQGRHRLQKIASRRLLECSFHASPIALAPLSSFWLELPRSHAARGDEFRSPALGGAIAAAASESRFLVMR